MLKPFNWVIFLERSQSLFNPDLRVDRYLLKNLEVARELLLEEDSSDLRSIRLAHALLWRTIFTCYLVDRGIIDSHYFSRIGLENAHTLLDLLEARSAEGAKDLLYNLFEQLQKDFNGDLFEGDLQIEKKLVEERHITILRRFLQWDDLETGQTSLGLWAYDFSIIPIETISCIYERFLEAEDFQGKRETGAYYTPRFLTEVVLDIALSDLTSLLDKRFLDPSCGSGIFLVALFNRLAEEWRKNHMNASNDELALALIDILQKNCFGIDSSDTACRISAFSLYLSFLDQLDPRDIQRLQKRGNALPNLVGRNIFCRDFFEDSLPELLLNFDFIVGNPPWVKVIGKKLSLMERWCKRSKLPIAQRQLAYGFLWKALHHLKSSGTVCFLLPAGVLLNHQEKSIEFQRKWFSEFKIEKVVNLADMRFYLFDGAIRPALIMKYRKGAPDIQTNQVEYISPKTEWKTLRAEIVTFLSEDVKHISYKKILSGLKEENTSPIWKQLFWGTSRDYKFLDRLRSYRTVGDLLAIENPELRWILLEGFNKGGKGEPVDRPILHELPFLHSSGVKLYVVPRLELQAEPPVFDPKYMGDEIVFRAPHILFPHGVSETGKRIRVGFCSFDCSFEHSIRGIHAPEKDDAELRFLTCALASPLALYFFFHTSANWGIERPKIHVEEYARFPFPEPDTETRQITLNRVATLHRHLEQEIQRNFLATGSLIETYSQEIDKAVFEYYDIDTWEEYLIKDTIEFYIPSATPRRGTKSIPTLEASKRNHQHDYISLLLEAINTWIRGSGKYIVGKLTTSAVSGLAIVSLARVHESISHVNSIEGESSERVDEILNRIKNYLPAEMRSLRIMRNLKIFDGNELHILKPLERRFWTKTSALNDADEIAAAILSGR
ncbi:MAG: N-6 DNA methylase [Leptolyngbyaceae cyanobacterium RM2_2_4]|nr:N-6 DNA methylase [Leptolyngbyaceae cyanobacterium RM2_2_4]